MSKLKYPEDYVKEYVRMFNQEPPDLIRESMKEKIAMLAEAIDSGEPIQELDNLDPNIDY